MQQVSWNQTLLSREYWGNLYEGGEVPHKNNYTVIIQDDNMIPGKDQTFSETIIDEIFVADVYNHYKSIYPGKT